MTSSRVRLGLPDPGAVLLVGLASLVLAAQYYALPGRVDRGNIDGLHKALLLGCALLYAVRHGVRWRLLAPAAALAAIAVLSFGPASFHGRLDALQVLRSFVGLSLPWLFLALPRGEREARRQALLLSWLPVLSVLLGLVLQTLGWHPLVVREYTGALRLQGASIPPYLAMTAVAGLLAALQESARGRRGFGLLASTNVLIVVLSGTRGAMLAAAVLLAAHAWSRGKAWRAQLAGTPVAGVLAFASMAVLYAYLPQLTERFMGNSLESAFNTSGRSAAWAFFYGVARVNLWFGRGLGAATVANSGQLPDAFRVPHNEYLRMLVDGGVVGLALLMVSIAVVFGQLRRLGGPSLRGSLLGAGIAFAVYSATDNTLSTPQFSVLFATALATMATQAREPEPAAGAGGPRRRRRAGPIADATPVQEESARPAPTVLFIAGCPRSGSTLVECIIAQHPGHVGVGELVHLWERGVKRDQLCACGRPFHACPFWAEVGRRAFGGWDAAPVEEVLRLQRRVGRHRALWRTGVEEDLHTYALVLRQLYTAVAEVSGACVVVDSSKLPVTAYALARTGAVDLRVLHLVRDPRGVAHSWSRLVRRPEITAADSYMPRRGPLRSSVEWLAFNALVELLRRRSVPYTRVRYEDLASDVPAALRQVSGLLGERPGDPAPAAGALSLPAGHSVAGNPMRFRAGPVVVHLDDGWRAHPSRGRRLLVAALALPGLLRYGYLRRRPAERASAVDPAPAVAAFRATLQGIAGGGLLNLGGAAAQALATFVFVATMTRGLGAHHAGILLQGIALCNILAAVGRLGADVGLVRFVSRRRALDGGSIGHDLRTALLPACAWVVVLAGALFAAAPVVGRWLGGADAAEASGVVRTLAACFPAIVLAQLLGAATQGFGTMLPVVAVDRIARPAVQALLCVGAVLLGARAPVVAAAWALPTALSGVALGVWLRRLERTQPTADGSRPHGTSFAAFWRFAAPRGLAAGGQLALDWVDVLIVGVLRSPMEAGVYAAGTRLLVPGLLAHQALVQVVQPRLSAFFATGQVEQARRLYQVSTGWLVLLTWPLYLSVYGLAPWLLGLLGGEFAAAVVPLRLLAVAMLLASLAGPVDAVLLMTGRSMLSALNIMAGLATNLALNALLIPAHGIVGAAAAWAAAIVVTKLLPLVELRALLRIHPIGPEVRAAAGAAATFGVACLVVQAFAGSAPAIACTAVATFTVLVWRQRGQLQLIGLLPAAQGSATDGR